MKNKSENNGDGDKPLHPSILLVIAFFVFGLLSVYGSLTGDFHSGAAFLLVSMMFLFFWKRVYEYSKGRLLFPKIPVTSIIFWTTSLVFLVTFIPLREPYVMNNAIEMASIFGVLGIIGVCCHIYKIRKLPKSEIFNSTTPANLFTRVMLFRVIPLWLAPFRILISSVAYILIKPEISPIIWIFQDSFLIVATSYFLVIGAYLYDYMKATFNKFGYSENALYFSLFAPLATLAILFLYSGNDTILLLERSPFEGQMFDVYEMARTVSDVENYLRSITVLDIKGHLFVGYAIIIIMMITSVLNLCQIFVNLKSLLFKSVKRNNSDKLHLIICTLILIVICIWALFAVALFFFPLSFGYDKPEPLHLFFDAFYFTCTSWMIGSLDITPTTVLSKSVVLISTISNILFFVVFITGLFTDPEQEPIEATPQIHTVKKDKNKIKRKK